MPRTAGIALGTEAANRKRPMRDGVKQEQNLGNRFRKISENPEQPK
jgi:hypothetical protein